MGWVWHGTDFHCDVKKPSCFLTSIAVPSAKMLIERISVMESVQGNGRLVYEERQHRCEARQETKRVSRMAAEE